MTSTKLLSLVLDASVFWGCDDRIDGAAISEGPTMNAVHITVTVSGTRRRFTWRVRVGEQLEWMLGSTSN